MDGTVIFICGYALPLLVMLAWVSWRLRSERKAGGGYTAHVARASWPLLLPGISLWGVCVLLLLATIEGSHWLERHWGPWRKIGEQSRRTARWMFGETGEG